MNCEIIKSITIINVLKMLFAISTFLTLFCSVLTEENHYIYMGDVIKTEYITNERVRYTYITSEKRDTTYYDIYTDDYSEIHIKNNKIYMHNIFTYTEFYFSICLVIGAILIIMLI